MRLAIGAIALFLSTIAAAERYGAPLADGTPISLETAIQRLDRADRADVLIEAQVEAVCAVKGCWMALKSPTGNMRVTFKDYGFFVPGSIVGKTVRVAGTLEKVVMTLEETKHYVKDAGGDPSTVTQPRTEYRIVATGVEVVTRDS
jgi:hypothetical protein